MRLNDMDAVAGEAWEKSSYASSVFDTKSTFDVRGALAALPTPQNKFEVSSEQIALMEQDIVMQEEETEHKMEEEVLDEEERQERLA